MARVLLTASFASLYAGGQTEHEVPGQTVRHLVRALDARYPGLGAALESGVAVAIDGEIYQNAFLEPVGPDSEVCFMPPIEGG
jgi:sulfur-carrier protein